jgi:glucose/arabinose dehydrogenase
MRLWTTIGRPGGVVHLACLLGVRFRDGAARGVEPLVSGFQLDDGERWARPAGVAFGPDGALYFTSDGGDTEGLFRLRRGLPPAETR